MSIPSKTVPVTQAMPTTTETIELVPAALQRLSQLAQVDDFDEALAVLAGADLGTGASAELVELRRVVAHELTRRAAHLFRELTWRAVHALGISPLTTDEMVEDDAVLHLVARRVPHEDAIGEEVHTACGDELWSDLETPLRAGMRGSWQAPAAYGVSRCGGCAEHAAAFPATKERPGDDDLTPAVAERLGAAVASDVRAALEQQMPQMASQGAVPALEAAERCYEDVLVARLGEEAAANGDLGLERVLLRYFATAQRELRALGCSGPLADLVSEADWEEMVGNLLEDLQESDNGAVAQSYLYGELRSILGERIRRERLSRRRRPATS